jgi:hypothetical protein
MGRPLSRTLQEFRPTASQTAPDLLPPLDSGSMHSPQNHGVALCEYRLAPAFNATGVFWPNR